MRNAVHRKQLSSELWKTDALYTWRLLKVWKKLISCKKEKTIEIWRRLARITTNTYSSRKFWTTCLEQKNKSSKIWEEQKILMTAPCISFDHYCKSFILERTLALGFSEILNVKGFSNFWNISYTMFIILNLKSYFTFTCG